MTATLDLFTGFEHGSLDYVDQYLATVVVTNAAARNGNYGLRIPANMSASLLLPTPTNELYVRFGVRPTYGAGPNYFSFRFLEDLGVHGLVNATAMWNLCLGGTSTVLATGGVVDFGNWCCLEVYYKCANAPNGRFTLRIDGIDILDYTGDTQNGLTGVINRIGFVGYVGGGNTDYDDLAVARDTWIGNGKSIDKAPNGAGDSTQLSIGGGDPTNWQAVDNRPPDPSKYVYGTTIDLYDLYALSSSGLSSGAVINAIQPWAFSKLNQAGTGNLAVGIKSGAVEDWSADVPLPSDTWKYVNKIYNTRPIAMGGGAWTQAVLDALQAGVKVR